MADEARLLVDWQVFCGDGGSGGEVVREFMFFHGGDDRVTSKDDKPNTPALPSALEARRQADPRRADLPDREVCQGLPGLPSGQGASHSGAALDPLDVLMLERVDRSS